MILQPVLEPSQVSSPVQSPCISVCEMDARTALCTGCQRTIQEIAAWGSMQDGEKQIVLHRIEARRKALHEKLP